MQDENVFTTVRELLNFKGVYVSVVDMLCVLRAHSYIHFFQALKKYYGNFLIMYAECYFNSSFTLQIVDRLKGLLDQVGVNYTQKSPDNGGY